jgi:hypothetical protein
MNDNTKLILAVIGVSALAAYLASKNKQKSNLIGKRKFAMPNIMGVPVRVKNFKGVPVRIKNFDGLFGGPEKFCPDGFKYVEYPMIKGFREHLSDSAGGKCVENSVDIPVEDSSIHLEPRLFI